MIGYCTLGTNDLERSGAFFDRIAKILGHCRLAETDRNIMWGLAGQGAILSVVKPFDGKAATCGNGAMFGLIARDEDQVRKVHQAALANGGSDEGAPGPRGDSGFYSGYFRDPDGNKLVVYMMNQN